MMALIYIQALCNVDNYEIRINLHVYKQTFTCKSLATESFAKIYLKNKRELAARDGNEQTVRLSKHLCGIKLNGATIVTLPQRNQ